MVSECLLADNAQLCFAEELDDFLNLRAVGYLFLDLQDRIKETRLSVEYQTVGIRNVLDGLLVDTVAL